MRRRIEQFNVFESGNANPRIIALEQWTSRIYIILLIATLTLLTAYTGFIAKVTTMEFNNPSYSTFKMLQEKHQDSLRCPCTKSNIESSKFGSVHSDFHQVSLIH